MALRLTRNAGTIVYGGWNLNPLNLEDSCDHRILIRSISKKEGQVDHAVVHLSAVGEGVEQHVLFVGGESIQLCDEVAVSLVNVGIYVIRDTPFCAACERGGDEQKNIPQASFAFAAPRAYQIIRDDAVKKTLGIRLQKPFV